MRRRARDIVVLGTHPFAAAVPLGDWHIARTLAQDHRVLWVDPPASPVAPLKGVASAAMFRRRPVRQAGELFVGCPIAHSGRMRPGHAPFVDRLMSAQIRRWMRQLHLTDVDLITFSPRFVALDSIPRRTLTVWMKDRDWAGEDVLHGDWLRARHEQLVRSADVVTGVSDELVADCRALGVEAARIPNGCDTEHYGKTQPEPTSMRDLGRPRIVFSGAWNWRVDDDLLAAAADRLPGFTFVVLGVARLAVPRTPNVHHVSAVPYAELPGYLQAGDVGIVPYRAGAFNAASCPLKVYEYLAAGLPVVTSGVDTAGLSNDLVRAVDGINGFVRAVEELTRRDVRAACREEAAKHSWDVRAQSLLELIDSAADTSVVHSGRKPLVS